MFYSVPLPISLFYACTVVITILDALYCMIFGHTALLVANPASIPPRLATVVGMIIANIVSHLTHHVSGC